jgi:hypothetical protein
MRYGAALALNVNPMEMARTSWFEWLVLLGVLSLMVMLGWQTDWLFHDVTNWGQSVMGTGAAQSTVLPVWIQASPAYALMATGALQLLDGTRLASHIPPLAVLYGALQITSLVLVFMLSRAQLPRPYPIIVMLLYGAYALMNLGTGLPSAAWVQGVFSLAALAAMGWAFQNPELPHQPDKLAWTSVWVSAAVWTHWLGWVVLLTFWIKSLFALGPKRMPLVIVLTVLALLPGVMWQWQVGGFHTGYGIGETLWQPLIQGIQNLWHADKPLRLIQQNGQWLLNQWADAMVGLPKALVINPGDPLAAVATPVSEQLTQVTTKGILAVIPWPCWVVGLLTLLGWIYTVRVPQTAVELYVLLTLAIGGLVMADAQTVGLPVWPLTVMLMMLGLHRLSGGLGHFGIPVGKVLVPGIALWVGFHLWQDFQTIHPVSRVPWQQTTPTTAPLNP